MAFPLYLAMTAAELQGADVPPDLCYMAIHFSPYATGLSNIPQQLPPGSILILNDRISIRGHDPKLVANQLAEAVHALDAEAVLLDWERPSTPEAAEIAAQIFSSAPCTVAATPAYAWDCPVFLPSPPVNTRLETYIAPWAHRKIWLEIGLEVQQFTVTEEGSSCQELPPWNAPREGHRDDKSACHYQIEVSPERALFTLWRDRDDIKKLLAQAETLNIQRAIGLYQQLADFI